jgi:hypothetical protein
LPNLWLEVRPTKAFAAQPQFDADDVILTLGVQAETRIVPTETRPTCPFPTQLDLVARTEQGRVHIAVPIDIPFPEIDKLLQDGSGPIDITIRGAGVAPSGDRLLRNLGRLPMAPRDHELLLNGGISLLS